MDSHMADMRLNKIIADAGITSRRGADELIMDGRVTVDGHQIRELGAKFDPEKVKAIVEWPTPTGVKDLRKWLGLANYLHKYMKNYADLARPLSDLLRKNKEWEWLPIHEQAFGTLKRNLQSAPILALPR
jgi:ribosomal protein S4